MQRYATASRPDYIIPIDITSGKSHYLYSAHFTLYSAVLQSGGVREISILCVTATKDKALTAFFNYHVILSPLGPTLNSTK